MEPRGEVFDIGYQHYEGPREGRVRAFRSVWMDGMRTALGLGRGSRAKILPFTLFAAALAPALVLSYVASQVAEVLPGVEVDIPSHADYYQIISVILLLFSAIIAPELLCPDRRDGVLSLYLVRPLTPTDYVVGRWAAFLTIMLLIAYSGQVILLIGFTLAAVDPLQHIQDNWLEVPRFIAAGFLVALFVTTLPMAVSAFTTRRAYAAAAVIGLFLLSNPVSEVLTSCSGGFDGEDVVVVRIEPDGSARRGQFLEQCERVTGDAAKWYALIDFGQAPSRLGDMIFDEEPESGTARLVGELPTAVTIGWYAFLTAGPGLVLWWRYRRMSV